MLLKYASDNDSQIQISEKSIPHSLLRSSCFGTTLHMVRLIFANTNSHFAPAQGIHTFHAAAFLGAESAKTNKMQSGLARRRQARLKDLNLHLRKLTGVGKPSNGLGICMGVGISVFILASNTTSNFVPAFCRLCAAAYPVIQASAEEGSCGSSS